MVVPIALDAGAPTDEAPDGPGPRLTLLVRGAHLKDHGGEIGYPGGKPDPGDVDLRATAAREMREEIGIAEEDVAWLGPLSPCPVITGRYVIHPFVAVVRAGVEPRIASAGEVERLLTLPILPVLRGEIPIYAVSGEWRGVQIFAPHFRIGARVLYGASAYFTYQLLARIAAALGVSLPAPIVEGAPPWGDRYHRDG